LVLVRRRTQCARTSSSFGDFFIRVWLELLASVLYTYYRQEKKKKKKKKKKN